MISFLLSIYFNKLLDYWNRQRNDVLFPHFLNHFTWVTPYPLSSLHSQVAGHLKLYQIWILAGMCQKINYFNFWKSTSYHQSSSSICRPRCALQCHLGKLVHSASVFCIHPCQHGVSLSSPWPAHMNSTHRVCFWNHNFSKYLLPIKGTHHHYCWWLYSSLKFRKILFELQWVLWIQWPSHFLISSIHCSFNSV